MSFDNLPRGWQLIPLEDAMDAIIDYRGKTPKKTESGIPLITAKIVKGGYVLEPFEFIAENNYDSWMVRGLPQVGDVVLTTEAPLGETAQLTSANVALAQRIVTLRGKNGLLDSDFLLCALQSDFVQHQLESRASGSTVKGIKQSELRKVSLPIPPLAEQRKISQVLKSLSNKLVCNTQTNQTLEEMAQAIFKSWFVDFDPVKAKMNGEQPEGMDAATASLFPEKLVESEKGLIPDGWKIGQVKELCKLVQNGGTPKRMESDYWTDGTINWFTTSELSDSPLIESKEKISELGLAKSSVKLWPEGTVLIAIYAAPTVGRLGILSQEAGSNQACTGLIPKTNEIGHYLFNSLYFARGWLNNISVGAAQQNISKGIVESLEIVIPSDELIESFGHHVETLWQKRLQLQKESQFLANLRDTLLPKLLSGEIELANTEDMAEVS